MVGPEVQSGVPGDIVQVLCEAESAPTPTGVIWTFLGRTILTGDCENVSYSKEKKGKLEKLEFPTSYLR